MYIKKTNKQKVISCIKYTIYEHMLILGLIKPSNLPKFTK